MQDDRACSRSRRDITKHKADAVPDRPQTTRMKITVIPLITIFKVVPDT